MLCMCVPFSPSVFFFFFFFFFRQRARKYDVSSKQNKNKSATREAHRKTHTLSIKFSAKSNNYN